VGTLDYGENYLIEVPPNWNGTLLFLCNHGYVVPGASSPVKDVGDPFTRFFMLSGGFALARLFVCHHRMGRPRSDL